MLCATVETSAPTAPANPTIFIRKPVIFATYARQFTPNVKAASAIPVGLKCETRHSC